MKRHLFCTLALCMLVCCIKASTNSTTYDADGIIALIMNKYMDDEPEEASYTEYSEHLYYTAENPLNINKATREDLEDLKILTYSQIENLLEYIYDYGSLLSIYELLLIEGFNNETLILCKPFFVCEKVGDKEKIKLSKILKTAKHNIIGQAGYCFQQKRGYTEKKYLGLPLGGYFKYKLKQEHLSLAFTAEHDAGEPFKTNKGFDFYSAHAMIKNIGSCKSFIIGDYKLNFGQGLVLKSDGTFGFSSNHDSFITCKDAISAYTSVSEYGYFRGVATGWHIKKVSFSAFFSRTSYSDGDNYHRTDSELKKKHSELKRTFGGNINYKGNKFKLGITAVHCLDYKNTNIGIDYRCRAGKFNIAGEAAIDQKYNFATIHKLNINLCSWLNYALIIRYYSKQYSTLFGNAYSQNSMSDESGILSSLLLTPFKNWTFNASFDMFEFKKPKYRLNKPSAGFKFNLRVSYTKNERIALNLKYSLQNKEANISGSNTVIKEISKYYKHNIDAAYNSKLFETLELNGGVKSSVYYADNQHNNINPAWVLYQNLKINLLSSKLRFTLGAAIFEADEYDGRIYLYEYGLPYSYSSSMYYGQGLRAYFIAKYTPVKQISLNLKVSHTYYSDGRQTIGSSWEEIKGCRKTDVKLLAEIKF